jgi:hypothetical protein
MRAIFPLAFLMVAAVLVLVVLHTIGIFNVWDFQNQQDKLINNTQHNDRDSNTGASHEEGNDGDNTPANPASSDNGAKPNIPTPGEDTTPPPTPTPSPDTEPPLPIIKDNTAPEGEFPDLKLPPPPADPASAGNQAEPPPTTSQDESPPKAGFLANKVLDQFLSAKTLDERIPFMSKSSRTRQELTASGLAGPLKPVKSILMVEMVPREEDNMTQYLYYVSFQDEAEEQQRQRIVMQVGERPGNQPPRVHADAFFEHYEKKFTHYAKHPNNDVTTFHCIAEARTAELAKNLPKELKNKMVRLEIKTHPHGSAAFNAYLNKNSPLMEQIGPRKPFPYTEARFCVLSFRWNTTHQSHPYIELNDIVGQGWDR